MKKLLLLLGVICCFALLAGQAGAQVIGESWASDNGSAADADPTGYFTGLTNPDDTRVTNPFELAEFGLPTELTGATHFTLREVGMLQIFTGGTYTFGLRSDDGSFLWLGDWMWPLGKSVDFASLPELPQSMPLTLTVNNWGYHGADPNVYGSITLQPGLYGIMAGMYQGTGGTALSVMYSGPDTAETMVAIPAGALYAISQSSPALGATNPTPAIGQTEVGIGTQTLSWKALPGTPALQEWRVYLSGNLADIADPNSTAVTPFVVTDLDPNNWLVSADLLDTTSYFWRVDAVVSEAEIATGPVWQFTTEDWGPIFTTQPVDTLASPACVGTLTATAENRNPEQGGTITYEWFQVAIGGDISVGTGDSVAVSPGESYYCVATNSIRSEKSNIVSVTARTSLINQMAIGDHENGVDTTYDETTGQYDLRNQGHDMRNNDHDDIRYVYRQVKGDFDIHCTIESLGGSGASKWRKFGLMARENLTQGSPYVFMGGTKGYGSVFMHRAVQDLEGGVDINGNVKYPEIAALFPSDTYSTSNRYGNTVTNEYWLRLARVGEIITGYVSDNGTDWVEYYTTSTSVVPLPESLYIGICNNTDQTDATGWVYTNFGNVTVNGRDFSSVPWNITDITTNADPGSGWVDYNSDAIVSWTYGPYTPCDAVFSVYATPNVSEMSNPPLIATTSDLSVTIPAAQLAHDQIWYVRVDVTSVAGGGDTQQGFWNTFETGKWVPSITVNPDAQYIVSAPSTAALTCQVATIDDDFANLTGFTWKKIVGTKDPAKSTNGDDVVVYTGTPTLLGVEGARNWDCSFTLPIAGVADEGVYYCVVRNTSGATASTDALVVTKRLMLHYAFESIVDNTVADSSPSGLTGVLTGPYEGSQIITGGIVPGIVGNAIKLVGGQDPNAAFVETGALPMELTIDGTLPRSISVWAKVRSLNSGGLWDMGSYIDSQNCSLRKQSMDTAFWGMDSNAWRVQHYGTGDIDFNFAPSFDTWVNFVYIFDGANCQIYANTQKIVDQTVALMNTGNDVSLKVGTWSNSVFDGLIDEFRVYNYVLSPAEIGQLYVEGAGGTVCAGNPEADRNGDCKVDMLDFALLAEAWAESTVIAP